MTDIVARLRKYGQHYEVCNEAAAEIEQLQQQIVHLKRTIDVMKAPEMEGE